MNIPAAVITARQLHTPVSECVESVWRSGFENLTVYSDGGYPPDYLRFEPLARVQVSRGRQGVWWNWINGVRHTLEQNPEADGILAVLGDVILARNVKKFIDEEWDTVSMPCLSLCVPQMLDKKIADGISVYRHLTGIWAVLLSYPAAKAIVEAADNTVDRVFPKRLGDGREDRSIDVFVSKVLNRSKCPIYYTRPSLAYHKHPGHNHQTIDFTEDAEQFATELTL